MRVLLVHLCIVEQHQVAADRLTKLTNLQLILDGCGHCVDRSCVQYVTGACCMCCYVVECRLVPRPPAAAEKMAAMFLILVHEKWRFIPVRRIAAMQLQLSGMLLYSV